MQKSPPLAVTAIFTIAKIWDAINDPIFGMIVDKTRFKKAKFTPWLKFSSLLLPLSTVLVFSIPSTIPMIARIVLAFITYAVWDILYTVSDVPAFALSTVMTENIKERSSLINWGRIGAMLGAIAINIGAPALISALNSGGYNGMLIGAVIFAIAAVVTMIPIGFIAKERAVVESAPTKKIPVLKKCCSI